MGTVNFKAVKLLRAYIRKEGIDIVHTHGYKQDIIGLLATRGLGCKLISTPHGWSRDAGFKLQCYEGINRLVFPFFDAVVPLSNDLYSPLSGLPFLKQRLHLILNGVDTGEILETPDIAPEIDQLKKDGSFVIGYIGQLIHRKGLDILFKAVSIQANPCQYRIVLVGDGEQRSFLEQAAKDMGIENQVHFYGFRQNRLAFLNGFDVFVLPSRLEGIPRCMMEAMTAKIPVVASNIPGCSDLVENGKTGFLFSKESVHGLAQAIDQVRRQPEKVSEMAEQGRQNILLDHSALRMAKEYTSLFVGLTAKNRDREAF